ncbi:MAG: FAD/NAD(P)-binding protein [Clostridia bacterium]|nr:FAD/NAD(P)-binding protein [Clostridia bacterium]
MNPETMLPAICTVTEIRTDTPDVKTFRVVSRDGKKPFEHLPGQCAMVSLPGIGEAMFSVTSSPTDLEWLEFSIKKCGHLTEWLHMLEPGMEVTVRGPYGRPFPVDDELLHKNLLFIAGGIGLAPLRSVIRYVRAKRENYGNVEIIYGARSKADLVDYDEITTEWTRDMNVHLTIDRAEDAWDGHVGFVPNYVKELSPSLDSVALVCGPPIMIKFTVQGLTELGFRPEQIYTTMELRMKCGVGKCGRCNIGAKYVCKDGPVFRFDELGELPDEY